MMSKLKNILSIVALVMVSSFVANAQVNKNNLDQNADQTQGNYAATNLNYLGGVGSIGMMQSAWKNPLQHMGEGQTKPGYSKYYWTPELVLPVRVREGMYTLINFPKWEMIESVYLGDGQSFTAQIQGPSSLMVYPDSSQFVGVDTNMIVFGRSGNKYVFYVQSETVNTDRITNAIIDIEVVSKKDNAQSGYKAGGTGGGNAYNGDSTEVDGIYTKNLQKEDWVEKIPVDPTQFRFDIEVYVPNPDDIIIAPERVWRDNIFTYIDLGEKALTSVQRPIVTLIVERSETPVGFRAAGPNNRLIIVEGIGDMVLRSGKRMVCLKMRRADTDGLENAIYSKSNEWDIQTNYASQPENSTQEDKIEDVFNDGNDLNNETENKEKSFFDFGSFFGNKEENKQSDKESMLNNKNSKADDFTINSIPKATTVVTPKVVSTESIEPKTESKLSGQFDIKTDNQELVVPVYNNAKENTKVTFEENLMNNNADMIKELSNDPSPVLISSSNEKEVSDENVANYTNALIDEFKKGYSGENKRNSNISIELGTDENVNNLEKLWDEISKRYSATIGKYQPFYSVDAPADGQGKELFHLRVGPINSLEDGDNICSQLGRNGIFCSVVRIQ